ncbi:hypothetical protein [Gymnodinialimonas sp.]
MELSERDQRLHDAVDRMLIARGKQPSSFKMGAPFDVTKPNFHDSKSEFLVEKAATEAALERSEGILDLLISGHTGNGHTDSLAAARICGFVDYNRQLDQQRKKPDTIPTFVLKGMVDNGLTTNLAFALHAFKRALSDRLQNLADQERDYWSGHSRPPNHFARAIALRFARHYCKEVGEMPTSGVSGEGGYPSTDFTRALQEVFEILDVRANVRNMADWAITQLSEDDLQKPSLLLGGLLGLPPATSRGDSFGD